MLALRFARVMIFSGPPSPKFMPETLVASDNVGDGGPELTGRPGDITRARRERDLAILVVERGVSKAQPRAGERGGKPRLE